MKISVSTNIEDFVSVDKNYLKEILTENTILERIINYVMINKTIPSKVKNEIIEYSGKDWFVINNEKEDNKDIFWKGVK